MPLSDFGDPASGELLQLCVYDQSAPGAYDLVLGGSPSVIDRGAWTESATVWKFKSAKQACPTGSRGVAQGRHKAKSD